jgi:hypothetical protein
MKVANCAHVLLIAATWLSAGAAWGASPGDGAPVPMSRTRSAPAAVGRLKGGPLSQNTSSLLSEPEAVAAPAADAEQASLEPQQSWSDLSEDSAGGCDSCCADGILRRGMWYGSVDYLLMRPRLSQGVAEVRRTLVSGTGTAAPTSSTLNDNSVEFPFRYQSAFRVAIGYRLLDCGGDIQVAYWRMTGNASITDGPANTETDNPFIAGQLKNNPANGQFFAASTGITANIFDVDFAKCLSMGGPCGPCDACYCPRWDLRWNAGARIADISRFDNNVTSDANGNAVTTGLIDARFVGAGPRVGMQGRRYFGANGCLSLFARANQSLLIGDYRMSRSKITPGDSEVGTVTTNQFDRFSRMVPVTDIEVGGSWQVAPYTYISAGYFFQCWWDLGQSETVIGTNFGPLDTANILGFDGFFVRGEMLF